MTETPLLVRHQVVEFATQFRHEDELIAELTGLYLTEYSKTKEAYELNIQMALLGKHPGYEPRHFHIDFGDESNGHTERIQCDKGGNCFQYLYKENIRDVERGQTKSLPTKNTINLAWP